MASEQGKPDISTWVVEQWAAKLASSIETMMERKPPVSTGGRIALDAPEVPQDALWQTIPLTLAPEAAIFAGATAASWLAIGKAALAGAGLPDSSDEDARGTYLEILTQTTSATAQALAERLERSIICLPAKDSPRAEIAAHGGFIPVDITLGEPPVARIYLGWTQVFETQIAIPAPAERPEPPPAPEAKIVKRPEFEKSRTLDLLLEVELPVSVSFGRADLPLRDVIKLSSGSIVELNRTISDPVEIIVNNCVIARGEVVVVEGNYGVRIQQVVSREERLRTLK